MSHSREKIIAAQALQALQLRRQWEKGVLTQKQYQDALSALQAGGETEEKPAANPAPTPQPDTSAQPNRIKEDREAVAARPLPAPPAEPGAKPRPKPAQQRRNVIPVQPPAPPIAAETAPKPRPEPVEQRRNVMSVQEAAFRAAVEPAVKRKLPEPEPRPKIVPKQEPVRREPLPSPAAIAESARRAASAAAEAKAKVTAAQEAKRPETPARSSKTEERPPVTEPVEPRQKPARDAEKTRMNLTFEAPRPVDPPPPRPPRRPPPESKVLLSKPAERSITMRCPRCSTDLNIYDRTTVLRCGECEAEIEVERRNLTISLKLLSEPGNSTDLNLSITNPTEELKKLRAEVVMLTNVKRVAGVLGILCGGAFTYAGLVDLAASNAMISVSILVCASALMGTVVCITKQTNKQRAEIGARIRAIMALDELR